jgi:hypothetical protein
MVFKPWYHYYQADRMNGGARSLENWNEIQASVERYKCTRSERAYRTKVTFFRKNPLVKGGPPREPPEVPLWALSAFATGEYRGPMNESELWRESDAIKQEKVKNL